VGESLAPSRARTSTDALQSVGVSVENRVLIDGTVSRPPVTRYSPTGVPISRFMLEHDSLQTEAGRDRRVTCRIPVVVAGKELAGAVAKLGAERLVQVEGFLSRDGYRREDEVVLHAHRIRFRSTID